VGNIWLTKGARAQFGGCNGTVNLMLWLEIDRGFMMLLCRSLLFVPALNGRAMSKAGTLPCDGVIVDLEDSVLPARKAEARAAAVDALRNPDFRAGLILVRVNAVDTEYFSSDIKTLAEIGPQAVVLPKVQSAKDVLAAQKILDAEPAARDTQIWIMIETALGVMNLREICTASKRLKGLILGPNDLVKDLHAIETAGQEAVMTSYGLCLVAARAYGLICIDGVYKQFTDAPGFERNCTQGRVMGFDGKSLIHPSQIAPANACFGPGEADIDLAKRQIQAFEAADAQGKGVASVDGELVEALHVDTARKVLQMADVIMKGNI